METIQYSNTQLDEVVEAIKAGKVFAFPTDTVYGLGVRYDDKDALDRLKAAKNRPDSKPIPMMVSNLSQIEEVAYVNEKAKQLIHSFMPGAFTIVLKRKESIADYVTNGLSTIAIRMPDDDFVLSVMDRLGKAMLVSSANISAEHSCSTGDDVLSQLDGRIDGIVMGLSKSSVASTIVDATSDELRILREGIITKEMIDRKMEEYDENSNGM